MDGPGEHYAKWNSQSEKDKYHMISLICECNELMNKVTNNRKRPIDTENRLRAVRGERDYGAWWKGKGIKQRKNNLIDPDNRVVITRGKGGGGR